MVKKLPSLIVLFLMISIQIFAQNIRGVVVSAADGEPMPGVSVVVKGTSSGTATDTKGAYSLKVSPNSTLIFSYIGFTNQEVAVGNRTLVDVVMQTDESVLNELVVTGFGISREQKALGYATSTIAAKDLTNVANTNVANALYGKAAGVRIAAAPGGSTSATNIVIRGVNSITGRSQPLIVMDGIPIRDGEVRNNDYWSDQRQRGNALNEINPEDIESISILKGASAAALYGSEAVNGVVMITTKKGAKGKKGFNVDFNANTSVDRVAYTPRFQNVRGNGMPLHVLNLGQDAKDGFVYVDTNGDGVKETRSVANTNLNFGPRFDGQPTMTFEGIQRPYEAQIGNWNALFQDAHNSQVNVAVSQATDNATMRFSLTRQDNEGVSLNSKNNRNIANLNTSYRFSKKFTTDLMVNYINQNVTNRPYSIDRLMNNFGGMMTRFENGEWYKDKAETSLGYRFVQGASAQSLTPEENIIYNGFKGDVADYMWRVNRHRTEERSNRIISSLTANYQILPSLNLRARASTDFTSLGTEDRRATERPLAFGNSGYFGMINDNFSIKYADVLLTYNKSLNDNLTLGLMGGYTAREEKFNSVSRNTNEGLSTENLFDVAASVNLAGGGQSRQSSVFDAFLGTANLNFKEFLFVEGTVRRDRTSTMNPNNNSFIYPSVNSSFVFSQAWDMPSFISFGKLRGSWGIVGNYPDRYRANIAYNQNTLGVQAIGGRPVLFTNIPSEFGNDLIRPEQKHEFEFGLETKLFKNKIGLEINYYNAQIRDQILPLTLPISSGAATVLTNVGTLRNQGVEFMINAVPFKRGNFAWEVDLTYGWNRNKVEKLANNATELLHADYDGNAAQLRSVVGQPMGDFYAHPIEKNANGQPIVQPSGLYKLDALNWMKVGNSQPKAVGGMVNRFSFKNFSLEALIDYRIGGHVMPTGVNWMLGRGLLEESTQFMDKESGGLSYYLGANGQGIQTTAATGPNGEAVFNDGMLMEGVTADGAPNTNVISQASYFWRTYNWGGPQYSSSRYDLFIQEATYVKMRELSLSYKVPTSIASKIGASNLQISVFGRNLFFLHRTLKHIDPEVLTAGSRWTQTVTNTGTNPATRTVGIMLRSSF
jgi:iron complex outermembrane receptor protein